MVESTKSSFRLISRLYIFFSYILTSSLFLSLFFYIYIRIPDLNYQDLNRWLTLVRVSPCENGLLISRLPATCGRRFAFYGTPRMHVSWQLTLHPLRTRPLPEANPPSACVYSFCLLSFPPFLFFSLPFLSFFFSLSFFSRSPSTSSI